MRFARALVPWDDRMDARMRELLAEMSASLAADALSREFATPVTRNAVIGRATRRKIPFGNPPNDGGQNTKTAARMKPGPRRPAGRDGALASSLFRGRAPNAPAAILAPSVVPDLDQAATHAVRFIDRRGDQCAWPLWDDDAPRPLINPMACGAPVAAVGQSWCAQHARKAWQGRAA